MKYWYKLEISYDGTDYFGWQYQPNKTTIQNTIKTTFLKSFKQNECHFVGASRTDAGVHAQGQVARLGTFININPNIITATLNKSLPESIKINSCIKLPNQESFHPQQGVLSKTYVYKIFTQRPCPINHRYGYYYWNTKLNIKKLEQTLELFVGTHNFKSFTKQKNHNIDTIRTITKITLDNDTTSETLIITIYGISFLQHMIRRIIGAALEIASNKHRSPYEISEILHHQNYIYKQLPTAPAHGLFLYKIIYQQNLN